MIRHIRQILVAILFAALIAYVVLVNDRQTTFSLGSFSITANSGVLTLTAFAIGVFSATLVASIFALRGYVREKRLLKKERERLAFFDGFVKARTQVALGDWEEAANLWQSIIKKDPTNIIAKVELSRALESLGKTDEALKVLDASRALHPTSLEILIRAAELNERLGNRTVALDNLALALYHQPRKKIAKWARDLSEELGRIEDAIEYHAKFSALGATDEEIEEGSNRLKRRKLGFKGDDVIEVKPPAARLSTP